MRPTRFLLLAFVLIATPLVHAQEFDPDEFAAAYFEAWVATQSPEATEEDVEHYLSFLAEDVGHQHLPYDPDATRHPTGKQEMREGMTYYLGAHTEYQGTLLDHMYGHDVVIIKYESASKGVHPQTGQEMVQQFVTVEVLELEDGKVSVVRKYSD